MKRSFMRRLFDNGWRLVDDPPAWADVTAVRGDETLIGEVKGYTGASIGLDVDTMFGQLLRRMVPGAATIWAVVVPPRSVRAVLRVPLEVRQALSIRVFEVREDDDVVEHLT